jgi:hypothetical protein
VVAGPWEAKSGPFFCAPRGNFQLQRRKLPVTYLCDFNVAGNKDMQSEVENTASWKSHYRVNRITFFPAALA